MSGSKINRTKRKVAGHVLMAIFHLQNSVNQMLPNYLLREYSSGLTDKEVLLIQEWYTRASRLAELYRVMAWRLLGAHHVGAKPRTRGARR